MMEMVVEFKRGTSNGPCTLDNYDTGFVKGTEAEPGEVGIRQTHISPQTRIFGGVL